MLRDRPLANEKHQCWSIKKILDLKSSARITEGTGFLPIRGLSRKGSLAGLPMGKKINILCVLHVGGKKILLLIRYRNYE